ncbi:26S proteasome non-ATPase regulatory subunit like [Actinidia chinensis var. chinensis]|uniref:26S proteasome non-ATPase regulatory subunit like n=1 Tax=Actinidia chinensis var. chinensis TaxID=1590841 RepID=A0A2R6Q1G7_ACTCC|nr:26S proteasome non-ATPase regulatory subunit like [Actinidia chinensis var. chinensis]
MGLPNGLLPLEDMVECGYVKDTGFVWLKQKNKIEHKFEEIGKLTSYATEVTAYCEPNKIKKLTGVKAKELLIWITLSDLYLNDPPTGKITFKSTTGLSRSFPVSSFEVEELPPKPQEVKDVTVNEASERVTVAMAQQVKEV